ncbi:MAG: ribonucleoside triphosphate reductase [Desulfobacteraceae bacterium]|jgi:ribonucleoside-triphosphate reductase|nr:MAG: ribonucleoside triphosphate reductase [Desulfobacteraceae bacterium]
MFQTIKKRDGRTVEFDAAKITSAIAKAGRATGEFGHDEAKRLTPKVLSLAQDSIHGSIPEVEEIQDLVEKVLLDSPYHKTAKAYILYRHQHSQIRSLSNAANADLVESYLFKQDWRVTENSNTRFSLQGLNNFISSHVSSEYWLNRIYPSEIGDAHRRGEFHIHDLDVLSAYCVGWDLRMLLRDGFRGVEGKVESLPPKDFRSALSQIVNFFYTLQGEAAGAQALSNFDTLLAPFVRYEGLDEMEVKQNLQEFVFNLNIPTRVGFRTPFTNITLDLQAPSTLRDEPVIVGGLIQKERYADFQHEMDLINTAFAEVMTEGDAKGRVFTFPIPTYNITPEFDWQNPKLDGIWRMTGKYGIPYFANFVHSDMSPDDARSMCCRLRLDTRELLKKGGALFGAGPLTGSIGVVTINLPRIGYLAKGEADFLDLLRVRVDLASESLTIKRKVIERFTEDGLYPYSKFYLREVKKGRGAYWKNHFATIGIIGMNEACLNFLGEDIGTEAGLRFSLKVMDFLRGLISDLQDRSCEMFNLEATPAEGASYRLAMLDKKAFPEILCANEVQYRKGSAPFYTNSTQLPVNYTDDLFRTLHLQDELQTKYTGGTALHIYLGEQVTDVEAIKGLIRKVVTNFRVPYFTLTPTFSVCPSHGYLKGQQERCPSCLKETEVYSRVVGYLSPTRQWNSGKQAEFEIRKTYTMP